jgi:carbamate kinase
MDFAAGSMGPKVEAACRFAELTGASAGIGRLDQAAAIVAGDAGTIVAGARYDGTRKPASPTSSSTPAASTAHQP